MTTASDDSKTRLASAPFDDPDADLILRTCDNVNFRVLKGILKLVSPIFKDMLSVPQPQATVDQKSQGQIPIVDITESSATIDTILRLSYPVEPPDLTSPNVTIPHIFDMLIAAEKYEMRSATTTVKHALKVRAGENERDAFSMYAHACHLKMENEARTAAASFLRFPLPGPQTSDLTLLSATDFYNLVEYHQNCSEAAAENPSAEELKVWGHPCRCGNCHISRIPRCWSSFLTDSLETTRPAPLDTSKLTLECLIQSLKSSNCIECHFCQSDLARLERLKDIIITSRKRRIDKVELKCSWK